MTSAMLSPSTPSLKPTRTPLVGPLIPLDCYFWMAESMFLTLLVSALAFSSSSTITLSLVTQVNPRLLRSFVGISYGLNYVQM